MHDKYPEGEKARGTGDKDEIMGKMKERALFT